MKKKNKAKRTHRRRISKDKKIPRELSKNEETQTSNHKKEEKANLKRKTKTMII